MSSDGIRVLVVDDDAKLRKFLRLELQARGMAVDAVGSGEEAVTRVGAAEYDVVLLGVQMPGMVGIATLGEIRRFGRAPEILILTGRGSADSAVKAMRSGAFNYVPKPFHLDALEVYIQKAASQRRLALRASALERILETDGPNSVGDQAALPR